MTQALQSRSVHPTQSSGEVGSSTPATMQADAWPMDVCHSAPAPLAEHALAVIEGEERAEMYLARLRSELVDPNELALMVSMLCGATLMGFCRVIEKALGIRRG